MVIVVRTSSEFIKSEYTENAKSMNSKKMNNVLHENHKVTVKFCFVFLLSFLKLYFHHHSKWMKMDVLYVRDEEKRGNNGNKMRNTCPMKRYTWHKNECLIYSFLQISQKSLIAQHPKHTY